VAAIVGVFGILLAPPAGAHDLTTTGWTYRTSSEDCVQGRAQAGDGSGHGSMGGYTWSYFASQYNVPFWGQYTAACDKWWSRPPGNVLLRVSFHRWNGSAWTLCAWTSWLYNQQSTFLLTYGYSFPRTPCGSGWYLTLTEAYVYNGGWHGGRLWTDPHWFS
jgi:hypothetical protein